MSAATSRARVFAIGLPESKRLPYVAACRPSSTRSGSTGSTPNGTSTCSRRAPNRPSRSARQWQADVNSHSWLAGTGIRGRKQRRSRARGSRQQVPGATAGRHVELLLMALSMNVSSNRARVTPMTAVRTDSPAQDGSATSSRPTCKVVVRGSSPLVGSTSDQALLRPESTPTSGRSNPFAGWAGGLVQRTAGLHAFAPAACAGRNCRVMEALGLMDAELEVVEAARRRAAAMAAGDGSALAAPRPCVPSATCGVWDQTLPPIRPFC